MEPLSQELRNAFLRVLDGANYVETARFTGWSRTVAKERIQKLARALQEVVGVVNVADDAEPTLELIVANREHYREALEHYAPERALSRRGHRPADADDLERVLAAITRRRRCRERDTAMVLTLFATGAKPAEITGLLVTDYLDVEGVVRAESVLRPQVTFNGIARPLYFTNPRMRQAIDLYLDYRRRIGHGTGCPGRYRGLDPDSHLFLLQNGEPFTDAKGDASAGNVHNLFYRLMRATGTKDLSTLSARRAVAGRLRRRGFDLDQIAYVLGLESKDSARRLLPDEVPPLAEAMAELF